jgi:CRISPR/Cas system-associated exonuclease Cas4 (RecB family)
MNKKDIFTPSEINKFIYCPRQWYFEKVYGKKKLRDALNTILAGGIHYEINDESMWLADDLPETDLDCISPK